MKERQYETMLAQLEGLTAGETNPTSVLANASALMRDVMESMYSEAYIRRYRFLFPLLGASVRSADPQRFLTLAEACLSCDTAGRLGGIRCPTLVVGGERDRVVTAAASRELAAGIGCALHMYPDYGHAAYDEAKDFNRLVYHFFKSHGEDKTT